MSYTVEKIASNKIKLSFVQSAEAFDEALSKAYLKNRGKINVPGFRKGKAPRKLIESMYGEGVFYDDAFELLAQDAYEEAVKAESLKPVDRPQVNVDEIGKGKELKYTIEVFVKPDVELGQYKGVEADKLTEKVTDEAVDARIQSDVERASTTQDITDRAVENGDIVNLDYAGSVDNVAFEGGTAEKQTLTIGSGSFIPGFEEQMIGMAIGEEKDLNVCFPEEYHAAELAGKNAVFHVKVNGIQAKVRPELDDDFAADVSEFDTLEAYKQNIRETLQKNAAQRAENQLEDALVQKVVDAAECDIPDAMIADECENMLREMQMRMAYQGIRFEDYLKYTNQSAEQVKENNKPEAKNRVKTQLVLEAIGQKEAIKASDDDVNETVAEQAKRMNRETEEFRSSLSEGQLDYLRETADIKKIIDFIKANAVITEKEAGEAVDAQKVVEAVENAAQTAGEAE